MQIKYAMRRFGVTRERSKGAGYKFSIPSEVLAELVADCKPVQKSKIDRVWTPPMTKYAISDVLAREAGRLRVV